MSRSPLLTAADKSAKRLAQQLPPSPPRPTKGSEQTESAARIAPHTNAFDGFSSWPGLNAASRLPHAATQCSTHPRKAHLLPLIERLVEARERGADRGGGGAHGGKPLAH
jgi:hypothetical protein